MGYVGTTIEEVGKEKQIKLEDKDFMIYNMLKELNSSIKDLTSAIVHSGGKR